MGSTPMVTTKHMDTNFTLKDGSELKAAASKLLDAAMEYWEVYARTLGGSAVVWVKDTDGRMVILTRGEYQATLMENIDKLHNMHDKIVHFDID